MKRDTVLIIIVVTMALVIGLICVAWLSERDTPEARTMQMTSVTSEDATKEAFELAGVLSDFERFHTLLLNTRFKDVTPDQKEETEVFLRRLYAVPVHSLLGRSVVSYYSVAILYDRMAIGATLATFREKGIFTEEDQDKVTRVIRQSQENMDFGAIFLRKLLHGTKDFAF